MKCPNCHCEISMNERICRYCGYDIETSQKGTIIRDSSALYYKDALQFYEQNYQIEKERNERYRQSTLITLLGIVAFLNLLEVILLILWK